jgi:hypothetical protein
VDRPGALTIQQYPDPVGRLRGWARAFVGGNPTDTLALLKDLSAGVSGWIRYQSRKDEGTQSPTLTLDRGWGSCRDFAVLFVEAARCLGFLEGAAPAGPARIPANPEPYMFWRLAIVDFMVAHSDVFAGSRAYR